MKPMSQLATVMSKGALTLAFHENRAESTNSSAASGVRTALGPEVPVMDAVTLKAGADATAGRSDGGTADVLPGNGRGGGSEWPWSCPAPTGSSLKRTAGASSAENPAWPREAPCANGFVA